MPLDANERFLTIKEVTHKVGMSRATIHRRIHDGDFPAQIRLSANKSVWTETAVLKWMEDVIA
jgi:prophage regulatory protein